MKSKTIFTKSLLALSCAALLASCAKRKDNTVDQAASLSKATISGRVSARLVDTIGAVTPQYVGAGTVISAWVDTRDYVLNSDTGTEYARKYFTGTTDANGYYHLDIEVSSTKAAKVHIIPSDFEASVLKLNYTGPAAGTTYTQRHVFTADPVADKTLNKGQSLIVDINYN